MVIEETFYINIYRRSKRNGSPLNDCDRYESDTPTVQLDYAVDELRDFVEAGQTGGYIPYQGPAPGEGQKYQYLYTIASGPDGVTREDFIKKHLPGCYDKESAFNPTYCFLGPSGILQRAYAGHPVHT